MSQSNIVLNRLIAELREQLGEAHTIAKAADVCASEGQYSRAFSIALDVEELIHSADHLLQAAATLHRSMKENEPTSE